MSLKRFDSLFESYLVSIALTQSQVENINQKLEETLSLFLSEYEGNVEIFAQGSYAMGTTVRPLTANQSPTAQAGEYDIDIALERTAWGDAKPTLREMRALLVDEYGELVDRKERETCERVHHDIDDDTDVGFHVDYVPIKHTDVRRAAKRTENRWFPSDTKELLEWYQTYADEYTFLPAVVLIMKRIRDHGGLTNDLPSICITALVCMYYEELDSYGDDLLSLLDKIVTHLSVPIEQLSITIEPVQDDLAKKLTPESHAKLLSFFKLCSQELRTAFVNKDTDNIRKYLSSSFPKDLNKYPDFLEALRNRGFGIELDGSLNVTNIDEDHGKGSYIKRNVRRFFGAGEKLLFRANEKDKSHYGVRWQVLNSTKSPQGKRRGNLFEARGAGGKEGSSSNKFANHETEQYDGEHWIKYYTYDKNTKRVIEIGRKFYVDVDK
jgi:predicted nucleotidyltransferase